MRSDALPPRDEEADRPLTLGNWRQNRARDRYSIEPFIPDVTVTQPMVRLSVRSHRNGIRSAIGQVVIPADAVKIRRLLAFFIGECRRSYRVFMETQPMGDEP